MTTFRVLFYIVLLAIAAVVLPRADLSQLSSVDPSLQALQ